MKELPKRARLTAEYVAKHGNGRQCTPEVIERICNMIRMGVTARTAAIACGIKSNTYQVWRCKGEGRYRDNHTGELRPKKIEPYATAIRMFDEASAEANARCVTELRAMTLDVPVLGPDGKQVYDAQGKPVMKEANPEIKERTLKFFIQRQPEWQAKQAVEVQVDAPAGEEDDGMDRLGRPKVRVGVQVFLPKEDE